MHSEITFDENESFVSIRTFGELSVEGFQHFLMELITHSKWKAGMSVLVDHRAASLAGLTVNDIQLISLLVKQLKDNLGSGGRCAIVLSDEFTKAAMWKVMTASEVGFEIEFFDSIEEARRWLSESSRTADA
ncbi:MAG TPA: STAS/SEC14 domain-containing protein [Candidatus Sulfobium mesophilum]|nr:STAS/SEC14 domain-containing protein [Candidatus Sulfobium mesophilum]